MYSKLVLILLYSWGWLWTHKPLPAFATAVVGSNRVPHAQPTRELFRIHMKTPISEGTFPSALYSPMCLSSYLTVCNAQHPKCLQKGLPNPGWVHLSYMPDAYQLSPRAEFWQHHLSNSGWTHLSTLVSASLPPTKKPIAYIPTGRETENVQAAVRVWAIISRMSECFLLIAITPGPDNEGWIYAATIEAFSGKYQS